MPEEKSKRGEDCIAILDEIIAILKGVRRKSLLGFDIIDLITEPLVKKI